MKKVYRFGWLALLLSAGICHAQQPLPLASPEMQEAFAQAPTRDDGRFWFRSDYLLWWVKPAPNSAPLATTGPFNPNTFVPGVSPTPGAFGDPNTTVLAGNNNVGLGAFSGFRLQGGMALDSGGTWGIEGGGFLLARRSTNFSTASDANGNPFLGVPFQDLSGKERVGAVAFANDDANRFGGAAGSISITNALQLWGLEANLSANLWNSSGLRADILFGFRYMDLQESLDIVGQTTPLGQPFFGSFAGGDVQLGQTMQIGDFFRTRNQFYGGQIGTRIGAALTDSINLEVIGKLALGSTHQTSSVNGTTTLLSPGAAPVVVPGGMFAQSSNIGTRTGNSFSVIPELGLNLSYQVTPRVRLLAGYSFVYWDNVVRPGNQIDRVVDPRGVPSFTSFTPGFSPTRPAPLFERSDFWAHGVNFGVELRF